MCSKETNNTSSLNKKPRARSQRQHALLRFWSFCRCFCSSSWQCKSAKHVLDPKHVLFRTKCLGLPNHPCHKSVLISVFVRHLQGISESADCKTRMIWTTKTCSKNKTTQRLYPQTCPCWSLSRNTGTDYPTKHAHLPTLRANWSLLKSTSVIFFFEAIINNFKHVKALWPPSKNMTHKSISPNITLKQLWKKKNRLTPLLYATLHLPTTRHPKTTHRLTDRSGGGASWKAAWRRAASAKRASFSTAGSKIWGESVWRRLGRSRNQQELVVEQLRGWYVWGVFGFYKVLWCLWMVFLCSGWIVSWHGCF